MGRRREEKRADRFLHLRAGTYQYMRRVPSDVVDLDSRAPMIRLSLRTDDLQKAMALRDIHERADNEFWASLIVGSDADAAQRRYKAAVSRAKALGFTYRPAVDIAAYEPTMAVVERIEAVMSKPAKSPESDAALGMAPVSGETISQALETYIDVIARDAIRHKSKEQRRIWENLKRSPVKLFIEVVADRAMHEITRADAQAFRDFWLDRVAPRDGKPTHSANMANKHLDALRVLHRKWFNFQGKKDMQNPFDGLRFDGKRAFQCTS